MGGVGSGRGKRQKAWRSKKRYITSLPEVPVPKLIHAHGDDPDNQSIAIIICPINLTKRGLK